MNKNIKTGIFCGGYAIKKAGGKFKTPRIHTIWSMMKQRVYNKNHTTYKRYGGRGIKVCDRWLGKKGFQNFYEDMNPSYEEHFIKYDNIRDTTLDRINNNCNYTQSNCKWSTVKEQANNMRTNYSKRIILFDNVKYNLLHLAKKFNVTPCYLVNKLKLQWSESEIKNGFKERPIDIKKVNFFKDHNYQTSKVLDTRERKIIKMKYFGKKFISNKTVGEKFNISYERVRQILKNITIKLI